MENVFCFKTSVLWPVMILSTCSFAERIRSDLISLTLHIYRSLRSWTVSKHQIERVLLACVTSSLSMYMSLVERFQHSTLVERKTFLIVHTVIQGPQKYLSTHLFICLHFIYLFTHLFMHLFGYLFTLLFIHLFACLFVYLHICLYLYIYAFIFYTLYSHLFT